MGASGKRSVGVEPGQKGSNIFNGWKGNQALFTGDFRAGNKLAFDEAVMNFFFVDFFFILNFLIFSTNFNNFIKFGFQTLVDAVHICTKLVVSLVQKKQRRISGL